MRHTTLRLNARQRACSARKQRAANDLEKKGNFMKLLSELHGMGLGTLSPNDNPSMNV